MGPIIISKGEIDRPSKQILEGTVDKGISAKGSVDEGRVTLKMSITSSQSWSRCGVPFTP